MAKRKSRQSPNPQAALEQLLATNPHDCSVQVCLASLNRGEDEPEFHRLRITDEVASEFRDITDKVLTRRRNSVNAGDHALRPYEAGAKLDPHEIEHVDLTQQQSVAGQIGSLASVVALPHFDGDDDILSSLRFYTIVLDPGRGNAPIFCFRLSNPKMELGRSRWFGIFLSGNEYDRFDSHMLLFDRHIDCICQGEVLFIFNKNNFQKIFRFFEAVREAARETLAIIQKSIPIHNFSDFEEACEGHLLMLAKLKNIADKPYLSQITMADIKKVIKEMDLSVETKKRGGKERLVFDPTDRWGILRLLDDDYLNSMMTGEKYEVNSKRPI